MHGVALACASMAGSGISLSTEVRRTAMAATIVDSPGHWSNWSNWLHQCVREVVGMLFCTDAIAGEAAVGELRRSRVQFAPLLCFPSSVFVRYSDSIEKDSSFIF